MATKITTWKPDTCDCTIDYSWDDTLSESERVHTLSSIIKCPAHQSIANNETAYNTVLDENPRKNLALFDALNLVSGLRDTTADGGIVLKSGISYNFSWSGTAPNRVLNVSFTGISLTTQQRNAIQSALNSRFGSGKVVLS